MFKVINKNCLTIKTNYYLATILQLAIIIFIYTLSRLYFYWHNATLFPDISFSYLLQLLFFGAKFDISVLGYINALFLFIRFLPVSNAWQAKLWKTSNIIFWVTNAIFIIGNIADAAYYPFNNSRTQATTIEGFVQDTNAIGILIGFIVPYWTTVLCFIFMVLLFIFLSNRVQHNINANKPFGIKTFFVRFGIMLLAIANTIYGIRGRVEAGYPLGIPDAALYVKHNRDINIVLNTPFTYLQSLGKKELLPPRNYMPDSATSLYYSPVHTPEVENSEPLKKNVVIIVLEGIGNAFIGKYNENTTIKDFKSHTPFLDSLCERSLVFENHYTTGRSSIKGINAILGSFPAYDIYYMNSPYNHNNIDGLPRLLEPYGFSSVFYCGCNKGSFSFENFSRAVGYKRFIGRGEYGNDADHDGHWGIYDDKMAKFILNDLEKMQEPFIASWFTLTSHGPYNLPKEFQGKYKNAKPYTMEESVEYVDEVLGSFFRDASAKAWYKNSIFLITADHSTIMPYPEYNTADLLYKVPLIIYTPDGSIAPGRSGIIASQLDITPTVLGHLKFCKPFISFGRNILMPDSSSFAVCWVDNNYQLVKGNYMLQFNGERTTGFYNISIDRLVENNIMSDTSTIQNQLETLIKAYLQNYTFRVKNNKIAWENEKK